MQKALCPLGEANENTGTGMLPAINLGEHTHNFGVVYGRRNTGS